MRLLEFDSGADSFELSLHGFGIFLGNGFLDLGGDAFDQGFGIGQTQAGDAADFLDDLDLLGTEGSHDNVKLGLLFHDGASGGTGSGSGNGGGGNTEGFLQRMNELGQLENGKAFDLFDHGSDFFTHWFFLHQ